MKNKIHSQVFYIQELLNFRWAKADFCKELNITQSAVNQFFNTWARTLWKRKEYTEAFNKCSETTYSYRELFNLVN